MIATPRLRLRPFGPADLPAFAAYRADPGVARHQSWDAGYTLADAERFLAEQAGRALGTPGSGSRSRSPTASATRCSATAPASC